MASPALRMGWLLRACGIVGVLATAIAVLVVPGVHGAFGEVRLLGLELDQISSILAYGMGVLLVLASLSGAWDLGRATRVSVIARIGALAPSVVAIGFFVPACVTRLPAAALWVLVLAASTVSIVAAIVSSRAPHTRAAGLAVGIFGLTALLRLIAWLFASYASARASTGTYDFARGLSTGAVVMEALGQMVCSAWLGARGRFGLIASGVGLALAFAIVLGASTGGAAGASSIQAMLHGSLSDLGGNPPPFGLGTIAVFLSASALMLAAAVLTQRGAPAALSASIALALLAHGGFDVPLRALAAVAAGLWIMITTSDQRAFWRAVKPATEPARRSRRP